MKKDEVIDFFGSIRETAHACELGEPAVRMWRTRLGPTQSDRVLVAGCQVKGVKATMSRFPKFFVRRTL